MNPTEELIRQLDSVRRFNSDQLELYNKVVAQRDMLISVLHEAKLQLEYLDEKFNRTGTSFHTIVAIDNALAKVEGTNDKI